MNTTTDSLKKNYATETSFYMENLTRVLVWFEGEDTDQEAQLRIDFCFISDEYIAKMDPGNLSDGIPMDYMKLVSEYCELHCKYLNKALKELNGLKSLYHHLDS